MKKLKSWLLLVSIFILIPLGEAKATTVGFVPSDGSASIGSNSYLYVDIHDVENLWFFDIGFSFDPDVLQIAKGPKGDYIIGSGGFFGEKDSGFSKSGSNVDGTVGAGENILDPNDPGQSGSGTLFITKFNAVGLGTTPLTFSHVTLWDPDMNVIPCEVTNGTFTVIPELTSLLLLGTGLVCLLGLKRKSC